MSLNPSQPSLMNLLLSEPPLRPGTVAIVGAGPGDPGLLTIRALGLIRQADALVYDRLVSPRILELVPAHAERFHVGKSSGHHCVPQERINDLLVQLAQAHRRVVRLKGGDPYIFGRGGEEAEFLAERGIGFQAVPGITSAAGCAACFGIPLTHRDYAQSVTFVTGHRKGEDELDLDWAQLAAPGQTRVFYMGLHNAPTIVRELTAHGLSADCPAALIERGTTPAQRLAVTSLGRLQTTIDQEGFRPPTLIIIGDVVRLADRLASPRPHPHTSEPERAVL